MAIIMMDGWDGYSAAADMVTHGPWTSRLGVSLNSNTRHGVGNSFYQGVDDYLTYRDPVNITTGKKMYINMAIMIPSWTDDKLFCYFGEVNSPDGFNVRSDVNYLFLYNGGTQIAQVANPFTAGVWHHFECQVEHHASAGSFVVRIDQVEVFNETGLATGTTQERLCMHSTLNGYDNGGCYIDDFVFFDDTGSRNNTWMGPVRVLELNPSGDNTVAWTRSGGTTNAENVDEGISDDADTTYVYESTVNNQDLYDVDNLPGPFDTVRAVQVHTRARKDDAGVKKIKNVVKVGATEQLGAEFNLADSYDTQIDLFETKDGINDWDSSAVDSMLLGVKLTADT